MHKCLSIVFILHTDSCHILAALYRFPSSSMARWLDGVIRLTYYVTPVLTPSCLIYISFPLSATASCLPSCWCPCLICLFAFVPAPAHHPTCFCLPPLLSGYPLLPGLSHCWLSTSVLHINLLLNKMFKNNLKDSMVGSITTGLSLE